MVLLDVQGVSKSFGDFRALDDVSLSVERGTFYGLVGANGAGKSTLFSVIAGHHRADAGRVLFAGQDISGMPTHRIIRRGIGISFQRAIPFSSMTVLENIALAVLGASGGSRCFTRSLLPRGGINRADEIIWRLALEPLRHRVIATLSQADLKRVDIGIALAGAPRLLLLDEPLAGLARGEREEMVGFIHESLRSQGTTLLFTEHDTEAVLQLAQRIGVLHRGKLLFEGTPGEVRQSREVRDAYLGGPGREPAGP